MNLASMFYYVLWTKYHLYLWILRITGINYRVRTGPWKPVKSCNLKIWIPGLESAGIFVEVLESPGIWTYRSRSRTIFLISVQEFSVKSCTLLFVLFQSLSTEALLSLKICLYCHVLRVHEFIEKVLEFDIERSWIVLEFEMSKCVWTLN